MGMSASQTRYVFLSGRKTDVEFDGQQINQQRTTLATQSSALNAQLLNLKVPTPPSVSDFSKTTYTLVANGKEQVVTGTQYQAATGDYTVNLSTRTTTPQGKSSGSSLFSSSIGAGGAVTYMIGQGTNTTVLLPVITNPLAPDYNSNEAITDRSNIALIQRDAGLPAGTVFFKYTTGNVTKYVTQTDLAADANSTRAIPTYFVDDNAEVTEHSTITGAQVAWNESGRMTSVTDSHGAVFPLTVKTTSDNEAYTSAMNEYEYQKGIYDKQMNDINAKMSIIQSEDKKLELKLKDLDTQQEAINTELDSVKKVVDKDIEQSFKAFA